MRLPGARVLRRPSLRRVVGGLRRPDIDLTARLGALTLPNPVMTASGTAGHGDELGSYLQLDTLGAVTVKSLAAFEWAGNPPPRLHPTAAGMLNSIGLQGPGIERWLADELPVLAGCRVVVSIWGRTVADYEAAATMLADAPDNVVALEVNLSCPNLDGGRHLFAHDAGLTREVMAATAVFTRPRFAKLSANTIELPRIATAAGEAGADAVTVANTMLGMVIDIEQRKLALGGGGGGLSGPAIHPIAVRAVFEVRAANPSLPIIGVGGIASGRDAIEMIMAGANAVQVGTASFADPRAPARVLDEMREWCRSHGVNRLDEIISAAQPDRS
ncbi:MAG: dihydroorotate dehydrogenase [Acidimicrobiia bacterium]